MKNNVTIQELIKIIKQQNDFVLKLMNSDLLTDKQQLIVAKKYNKIYIQAGKYIDKI